MISHENIINNSGCDVVGDHPIGVSWLPHFHDMGLIGYYLFPIVWGGSIYHFSSNDFLRRPLLWLEAITRFGATGTSAPNFAFEYCLRPDKISDDDLQRLNLNTLRIMMNASDLVLPDTMKRFFARFSAAGLSRKALSAAYGLAESTLCASIGGREHVRVSRRFMQRNKVRLVQDYSQEHDTVEIASCGKPIPGTEIRIVEPGIGRTAAADQIGEIWLAGKSKALGYWKRPDLSKEIFKARVDGSRSEFVRTGDVGFVHNDELYVCGRLKDMILVRGVNVYPTDIEAIVDRALAPLHHVRLSVFGFGPTEENEDGVVVLVEVSSSATAPDLPTLHRKLKAHLNVPISHSSVRIKRFPSRHVIWKDCATSLP